LKESGSTTKSTSKSAAKSSQRPPVVGFEGGFDGGASAADHELLQAALIAHEAGDAALAGAWCHETLDRAPHCSLPVGHAA